MVSRSFPFQGSVIYIIGYILQITKDRKKRVIDLYFNQHKTYAEIAQIEKMSPRDINAIIKEEQARRLQHKQQEISIQAYQLFSEGKKPVEVAIALNLRAPEVTNMYREYWRLKRLHKLNLTYKETNGKLLSFLKLYRLLNEKGMSIEQVVFNDYFPRRTEKCKLIHLGSWL
jgi:predicted transcriptional regulator